MKKKINKEIVSYRTIGERLNMSPSWVWEILDKVKFRFERNKRLMLYLESEDWDIEKLLLELG